MFDEVNNTPNHVFKAELTSVVLFVEADDEKSKAISSLLKD